MGRQRGLRIPQSSKIDDALDALLLCRLAEIAGGEDVGILELAQADEHGMNQVVCRIHAFQGPGHLIPI